MKVMRMIQEDQKKDTRGFREREAIRNNQMTAVLLLYAPRIEMITAA
jgi:hypothetical protein